jgi:drug/metabolite transporter (DMT)-like permease
MKFKSWQAELGLLLVTLVWGGTFLFTKVGLEDCPPSLFMAMRFSLALIASLIFFRKYLKKMTIPILKQGSFLGVMFAVGFVFQTYGLQYTKVSSSAFITGMTVVLTPIAYYFVEKKKINFWQIIGVITAYAGLIIFTNPKLGSLNSGDLLTAVSCIFWAIYITYMDVFTRGKEDFSETALLVIGQFLPAIPITLLMYFIFDYGVPVKFTTSLISGLLYNGIIASFILTVIHTAVQRFTTPVKAALIFSLEPVFASIFAIMFIGEILKGNELSGGVILMFGVLISELAPMLFTKKIEK